ncbi:flagellar brake protein [Cellvibrio japonicus]|uniref:PilZ domain-containing protein n=1 Tax=Cellvibrio japonicus (strain Ueda107) TaxID=498211 RepID=B3PID7_CELJU|nr:PilZ domain-containing protein [Cellvibrio japonicus]ACE85255.1 hypothetical protein CJA_2077 [Cellvibrio japonicus Ueda107]
MSIFKKWFNKVPSRGMAESHLPEADTNLSLASHIPDQYLVLWQLYKQRQLLEIRLGSASRTYQSMILALDIERGLMWLDDLFPQQLILDTGDEITIRHHRQSEQLLIRTHITALGSTYGASGLAVPLPEQAHYTARRASARFHVASETPILVRIRTLGQDPCCGTLQDISSGGIKLHVAGNLLPHLRHGVQLPLCEFRLNDELQIHCRARVCAFRLMRAPYRCTQISLEFLDLPVEKRIAIEHYLQWANQQTAPANQRRFRVA